MALDHQGDDGGHVGLGIDAVELAGLDQRGDDGPVTCAAVRAGEQRVLSRECERADGALDGVVVCGFRFKPAGYSDLKSATIPE